MPPSVLAHLADDQTGAMCQVTQAQVDDLDRLQFTLEDAGQSEEAACAFVAARLVSAGLFLREARSHDALMEAVYEAFHAAEALRP